jgi:hypothetical protein
MQQAPAAICAGSAASQHVWLRNIVHCAVMIPTCKLFWSDDERLLIQFKADALRRAFMNPIACNFVSY